MIILFGCSINNQKNKIKKKQTDNRVSTRLKDFRIIFWECRIATSAYHYYATLTLTSNTVFTILFIKPTPSCILFFCCYCNEHLRIWFHCSAIDISFLGIIRVDTPCRKVTDNVLVARLVCVRGTFSCKITAYKPIRGGVLSFGLYTPQFTTSRNIKASNR